tara:strand:+ start:254 stop:607 length:354 start_codon:yes stop_codon:yes gene_type:complete
MPVLGKAVFGKNSLEVVKKIQQELEHRTKTTATRNKTQPRHLTNLVVASLTLDRFLDVKGTTVKFSYNHSGRGFGTIRWLKNQGDGNWLIIKTILTITDEPGVPRNKLLQVLFRGER